MKNYIALICLVLLSKKAMYTNCVNTECWPFISGEIEYYHKVPYDFDPDVCKSFCLKYYKNYGDKK